MDTSTSATLCTVAGDLGWCGELHLQRRAPGTYHVKVNIGGRYTGTTATDTTLTVTATPATTGITVTPPASPHHVGAVLRRRSAWCSSRRPRIVRPACSPPRSPAGTPLPTGLTLSARSGTDTAASWTITGTYVVAPGTYNVTVKITDGTQTVDLPLTFIVNPENSQVSYTGPTSAATAPGGPTVDVPLTATAGRRPRTAAPVT